jgi:hypothetical protein
MEPGTDASAGRRVKWQAAALALVVAGDGIVAYTLGGPAWLAAVYVVLAIALSGGRIWLARRSVAPARTAPAVETPAAPPPPEAPARAIGYALIDSPNNGQLTAHAQAIEACCAERGLQVTSLVHDVDGSQARPSLVWALEQLAERKADALVVPHLRDLSRNVANLPPLLSWFDERSTGG